MFAEPFAAGHTWVHLLDPRLRALLALLFSCLLAGASKMAQALGAVLVAAFFLLNARPPWRALFCRLMAVNLFLLFLWLTVPWNTTGPQLFSLAGMGYGLDGVRQMGLITLKANAINLFVLACLATMPVSSLGHALYALHVPKKFVLLLLLSYRAIFLLADEWRRLTLALKLRVFTPKANMHTYRTMGALLGLCLVRAVDRAERIHQAMLLRGFHGTFTSLATFQPGWRDLLCLAVFATFLFFYFFVA